jgi:hypothetical protein
MLVRLTPPVRTGKVLENGREFEIFGFGTGKNTVGDDDVYYKDAGPGGGLALGHSMCQGRLGN